MNNTTQKVSNISTETTVKRILTDGCLTRREYFELVTLFLSELSVTEKERFYLNQLLDELQLGHLYFV